MKIVSLVPSASEIICDLGLEKNLVGVSHECNYPISLRKINTVTSSNIDSNKSVSYTHLPLPTKMIV